MKLRLSFIVPASLVVLALAAGCGKKADQAATNASSDSLLATSPIEQPQGQIQPQTGTEAGGSTTNPAPAPSSQGTPRPVHRTPKPGGAPAPAPGIEVAAGTPVKISVDVALSSETAQPGQSWEGTVKEAVTVGSSAPFPAGSVVHGVVEGVAPAAKGDRAFLVLHVTSIESNGHSVEIGATADSIIAGSTRKRNVGAIVGSAAAGAVLGKAIGGGGKGAVIGGLLGGAAATGVVAHSKGFQAEVEKGKEMVFRVDRDTRVRL